MKTTSAILSSVLAALLAGCAGEPVGDDGDTTCDGDKCDTPNDPAALSCERRKAEATASGQKATTPTHIRWACSDVAGVNTAGSDSRGQEYCEYFAVVQPPPATPSGPRPAAIDLGRKTGKTSTTPLALELNEEQIFWLEDHPADVIGQCVFSSWHQDVAPAYPACQSATSCPDIMGFQITADFLRMKDSVNSNSAANDLVIKCYKSPTAADMPPGVEVPEDDYTRGCMMAAANWGTEWRRSDPTICAGVMRLKECGCGLDTNGDGKADLYDQQLADALVPAQPSSGPVTLRGFPLGTWSAANALPAGCRYFQTGESSQTLVTCDLTADDVLKNRTDPKGACRSKYGDDVVVHIPLPKTGLVCEPPAGGKFADDCTATPWIL
jgi:hypothetical protein